MNQHLEMVTRLTEAMNSGEFQMFFQPQFCAKGKQPIGLESLIRWRHPERGLIPPAVFLAICEGSGLIVPLGQWVLREACRFHKRLAEAGLAEISISVNVSTVQFLNGSLVKDLEKLVDEFGLPAGALELELSEKTIMQEPDRAIAIMAAVRNLGVHVALDAFGTGYTSMSFLQRVPMDKLKIDRSFVHMVGQDSNNAAICKSIISMGHGFGLTVVAEGVEMAEEYAWLRDNGCDGVQGYLFARPAPFEDMLKALGSLPA